MTKWLIIIKNKHWLIAQSIIILSISAMSFFSLWLTRIGLDEKWILLSLALSYVANFTLLSLAPKAKYLAGMMLLLTSIFLAFFHQSKEVFSGLFCLFIAALQLSRDISIVRLVREYEPLAKKMQDTVKSVVSITMLLGVISTSTFLFLLGYLLSVNSHVYFTIIAIAGAIIALNSLSGESKSKPSAGDNVPANIHYINSLSMVANSSMFFVRYYLIPMLVLEFTKSVGLDKYSFTAIGTVVGVMSLLGFIFSSNADESACRKGTFTGYFGSMVACASIVVLYVTHQALPVYLALSIFLVSMVVLEISSKVWTINYICHLKAESKRTDCEQGAFMWFMRYKSLGGFIGFFAAFIMHGLLPIECISAIIIACASIYAWVIWLSRKDLTKDIKDPVSC